MEVKVKVVAGRGVEASLGGFDVGERFAHCEASWSGGFYRWRRYSDSQATRKDLHRSSQFFVQKTSNTYDAPWHSQNQSNAPPKPKLRGCSCSARAGRIGYETGSKPYSHVQSGVIEECRWSNFDCSLLTRVINKIKFHVR